MSISLKLVLELLRRKLSLAVRTLLGTGFPLATLFKGFVSSSGAPDSPLVVAMAAELPSKDLLDLDNILDSTKVLKVLNRLTSTTDFFRMLEDTLELRLTQ